MPPLRERCCLLFQLACGMLLLELPPVPYEKTACCPLSQDSALVEIMYVDRLAETIGDGLPLCRCRQVTASLPDMAALQAAIRGQPRPGQSDAERAESRLLPDVAVAERAHTLQTVQAAAEQV